MKREKQSFRVWVGGWIVMMFRGLLCCCPNTAGARDAIKIEKIKLVTEQV